MMTFDIESVEDNNIEQFRTQKNLVNFVTQ